MMSMWWISTALGSVITVPGDYSTVAEAVAEASSGDTIELGPGDWSGEEIDISSTTTLTFTSSSGADKTIGPVVSAVFADLTFTDLTVPCDVGAWTVSTGSITVDGAVADGCGVAVIAYNAPAEVSNSTFTNGLGGRGSAIYSDGGLTVSDSTFTDNSVVALLEFADSCGSDGCGGAIYATDGDVTITDCTFTGSSADQGGAVYLADDIGDVLISGTSFQGGSSDDVGGALVVIDADEVVLHDVYVQGNSSTDGGAVSLIDVPSVEITWSTFVENEGEGDGGALFIDGGSAASVSSSWFCGNSADQQAADVLVGSLEFGIGLYGTAFGLSVGEASVEAEGGSVVMKNATFAGARDSAIVVNGYGATLTNVLFLDQGDYAVALYDDASADGSYNALYAPDGLGWVFDGREADLTVDSMEDIDPLVQSYTAGVSTCDDLVLWLDADSPLRDAGDPDIEDVDGSSSDIGAYGGPDADLVDADGDDFYEDLDCDDEDEDVNPDAEEVADDGIDNDCDGEELVTSPSDTETDTDDPSTDTDDPGTDTDDTEAPSDTEVPSDTDEPSDSDTDSDTDVDEGCQGCAAGGAPLGLTWMLLPLLALRRRDG